MVTNTPTAPATSTATTSIVLAGVGGQGIVLAGQIIARAAMVAGHQVKTNEVHGMAQRGGSVVGQVRYGPVVHSPLVAERTARVLAAFEGVEAIRYAHFLAPPPDPGLAVVAKYQIVPVTVSSGNAVYPTDIEARLKRVFPRLIYFDAVKIAVDLGNIRGANVVVLGALSTGLDLPVAAWHEAVAQSIKAKYVDFNLKAFEAGRAAMG